MIKVMREPDMVDRFGTKWWQDKLGTESIQKVKPEASMWLIEELNGRQVFVLAAPVLDIPTGVRVTKVLHEAVTIQELFHYIERNAV